MWWLWACSADVLTVAKVSDEEFYDESNWENGEDSPNDNGVSDESTAFHWWNVQADLHLIDGFLNKEKSTAEITLFSAEHELLCSVVFQFEEALRTEPTFEEGLLWWRILLQEGSEDLQNNICSNLDGLPNLLHLGVGSLHVESLAVWSDIVWDEMEPPERDEALSSYISLDNGENIWVYGGAKAEKEVGADGVNIIYLRPAYFFPMREGN